MELSTALGIAMGALLIVIAAVIYLNQSGSNHGQKLVALMKPYELAFESYKKRTYASGQLQGVWTVVYIQPKGDGDQARLRVRCRIDLPSAPRFYLSSVKTRQWLMKNQHAMAKNWPRSDERFYVQVLDRDVNDLALVQALSPATLELIDAYEREFDGLLVYSIDANLFEKADAELLKLYPELQHELVLFTHIEVNNQLTAQQFQQFLYATTGLAQAFEADLRRLFKMEEAHVDKTRTLRIKRFQQ